MKFPVAVVIEFLTLQTYYFPFSLSQLETLIKQTTHTHTNPTCNYYKS